MEYEILNTDEYNEAFQALKKTSEILVQVKSDIYQWKWIIIILHNCTQCFMVLALMGTASINITQKDNSDINNFEELKNLNFNDEEDCKRISRIYFDLLSKKETRIINFANLYKLIKNEDVMHRLGYNEEFRAKNQHDNAIKYLNCWRSKFIHYYPAHWSIFTQPLPDLFQYIFEIIEFLVNNSRFMQFKFGDERFGHILYLINDCRKSLESLKLNRK